MLSCLGSRSISCPFVWRCQPLCYSCKTSDTYAKRYAASSPYTWPVWYPLSERDSCQVVKIHHLKTVMTKLLVLTDDSQVDMSFTFQQDSNLLMHITVFLGFIVADSVFLHICVNIILPFVGCLYAIFWLLFFCPVVVWWHNGLCVGLAVKRLQVWLLLRIGCITTLGKLFTSIWSYYQAVLFDTGENSVVIRRTM